MEGSANVAGAEGGPGSVPVNERPPPLADHRGRLIVAMTAVVADKGYLETTVQDVLERSGVSRRTFYSHFKDKQDCFLAAHKLAWDAMHTRVAEAFEVPGPWPQRIRSALRAALETIEAEPELARIWVVEPLVAGPEALARYAEGVATFQAYVEEGREHALVSELPEEVSLHTIAGLTAVIYGRIVAGQTETVGELLPALTYATLAPYLGVEEAWRIAQEA